MTSLISKLLRRQAADPAPETVEVEVDLTTEQDLPDPAPDSASEVWFEEFGERVRKTAATLAASSGEITYFSEETDRAAGDIATTVETVNAAVERQKQMLAEVADIARRTRAVADMGNAAIAQLSETTAALGAKSSEIGGIVRSISDVADQSTVLSLNAALEAARAGEHGRGFGVVATEVHKLADESRKAAGEIGNKIADIQGAIMAAESEARSSFESIAQGIAELDDTLAELLTVADETSTAGGAASATSHEAKSNAAELFGSSQNLAEISAELQTVIREFSQPPLATSKEEPSA
jgi:methyl-accepting chemotaxis protein